MKSHLDEDWVTLGPEPQWGELFYLFSNVLSGQLSIEPFLPQKGIGEKDQDETTRKRKRDLFTSEDSHATKIRTGSTCEEGGFGQRRERGFPGIEVKAHTAVMSLESILTRNTSKFAVLEFYNFSPSEGSHEGDAPGSSELVQSKRLTSSNPQFLNPVRENKYDSQDHIRSESLDWHSIDIYEEYDDMKVPMLEQVHAAIVDAGEEGISIGDTIEVNGFEGKTLLFSLRVVRFQCIRII